MADKVQRGKLSQFKPADRNSNKHTAKGLKALANSMSNDGYVAPMTAAADGEILDGSARLETAFEKFGDNALIVKHDGKTPIVMVREDIPSADDPLARRIHYRANMVSWLDFSLDPDIVMADIEAGFNFEAIDISLPDLGEMLEGAARELLRGNGQPPEPEAPPIDRAEELQAKWQVKTGQVWQMGRHFIICGDCREPETWQRLLDAAGLDKVNGVFTSPPYAEQRKAQYGGVPTAEYVEWWGAVQTNVRAALAGDGSFFINIKEHCEDGQRATYCKKLVIAMVDAWGWRYHDELYWQKPSPTPHDILDVQRFYDGIEPIYHFSLTRPIKFCPKNVMVERDDLARIEIKKENERRRTRAIAGNDRPIYSSTGSGYHRSITQMNENYKYPPNVIRVSPSNETSHAAAFPVALPTFFLKAYSDPGDSWVDPFCGSGTVLVACQNEGRIGLGIERLEKYCAVILERLATLGIEPRLLSTESTL